jgi:DNA-binding NarL/FixJ family response regulator
MAYVLKGVSALRTARHRARVAAGESYVPPALAGRLLGEFARARNDQARSTALTGARGRGAGVLAQGLTNREIGARCTWRKRPSSTT